MLIMTDFEKSGRDFQYWRVISDILWKSSFPLSLTLVTSHDWTFTFRTRCKEFEANLEQQYSFVQGEANPIIMTVHRYSENHQVRMYLAANIILCNGD